MTSSDAISSHRVQHKFGFVDTGAETEHSNARYPAEEPNDLTKNRTIPQKRRAGNG